MKKYKINNYIIQAKDAVHATEIYKKIKDSDLPKKGDKYEDKRWTYVVKSTYSPFGKLSVIDLTREDGKNFTVGRNEFERHFRKMNDSVKDDDLSMLTSEEEKAVEDYKRAISNTKDVKLLKLFSHILQEETEHLEELQKEDVEDSIKDERLSPMTYKKLKELGVNSNQWKNWTQEQANRYIQNKSKSSKENKKEKIVASHKVIEELSEGESIDDYKDILKKYNLNIEKLSGNKVKITGRKEDIIKYYDKEIGIDEDMIGIEDSELEDEDLDELFEKQKNR